MYTFILKDNGPGLDMVLTRAMLAIAAIAAIVYRSDEFYYLGLISSVSLVVAAVFLKVLMVKFRFRKFVLLAGAAVALLIATHSFGLALVLLVYGYLVKYLYQKPVIQITNEGIIIKKLFASPAYQWNEFSNIILRDNLLTLDFKNNKLLQLSIDENKTAVDEKAFNEFCKDLI